MDGWEVEFNDDRWIRGSWQKSTNQMQHPFPFKDNAFDMRVDSVELDYL